MKNLTKKYRLYAAYNVFSIIQLSNSRADEKEQILMGEIDLELANKTRRQIPSLENVRQDVYDLVEKLVKIY